MARDIVVELVTSSQMSALEDWFTSGMVELLLTEVVLSSEDARVMINLELVSGMETRLIEELYQRERVRQRNARISRRMKLESGWMARRLTGGRGEHMKLEEHVLDLMLATVGLEEYDLCRI